MIEQAAIASASFSEPPERRSEAISASDSSTDAMRPEIALLELLTELALRKSLIAKIAITAMAIGIAVSLVLPVRYTATTRIMPPQQTQSAASLVMNQLTGLSGGPLAAIAGGGGLGLKNPNDIYIGLLMSRPVADAIIRKFNLENVYGASDMTKVRKMLADYTEVASEKTGFIAVSVTDRDKKRAAEMANAYMEELRTLTKSLAVTEASQRRLFYEDQLKQSKETLVAAALAFQQVQEQKGLVQLDAQAKVMIEGLAELRAKVAAKQVEVQALRSYSTEQNPVLQLAERELTALEAEETRLEQRNHAPGVANLGLENVPSAGLEYLRAEHELQYQQALYDMLLKQYDAARLDESKDAAVIQVVEPAVAPDRKSQPRRPLTVLLFLSIGLSVGCIAALFLWWKETLQLDPVSARQLAALGIAFRGQRR
jgi:uncharacterized protein involved in exopolysaccharide biosynthesis